MRCAPAPSAVVADAVIVLRGRGETGGGAPVPRRVGVVPVRGFWCSRRGWRDNLAC